MNTSNSYDVTIIGAGVSGLVCGCYLSKKGLKTAIIEQHHNIGGYCSSFKRGGFTFDSCVHSFGSCRPGGQIDRIFNDLNLGEFTKICRANPSDGISIGQYRILIENDIEKTIENFQHAFPNESHTIRTFFNFIITTPFLELIVKLKTKTFEDLLKKFFSSPQIRSILCAFLGNLGLPANKLSALTGVILYREFVLDGGYYPEGGMQEFSNSLSKRFQSYGGELLLSSTVEKILVNNHAIGGLQLDNKHIIQSKAVVAASDARHLFTQLIDKQHSPNPFLRKLTALTPSSSAFVVYLGFKTMVSDSLPLKCRTVWFSPDYVDTNKIYYETFRNKIDLRSKHILVNFSSKFDSKMAPQNKESIFLLLTTPFMNKTYWEKHRAQLTANIISRLELLIPHASKNIEIINTATPQTFFNYTGNYNGAGYGWASLPTQISYKILPQETFVNGLFLAGHWCTLGGGQGGIAPAAYSGFYASKLASRYLANSK